MIEFLHVSKSYPGDYQALCDVSLFIDKGEFVFLTGRSGAGKTTFLKHIYIEERPSVGQVFVFGYDAKYIRRGEIPFLRRRLGIVFQDFKLLTDRNVFENVAFAARAAGMSERQVKRRTFEVLAATGIGHKCVQNPASLSGGEQQRVCIARAMVNDPLVLLADEPTGNLDPLVADDIFQLLRNINTAGTTVVMSTHELRFLEHSHYRRINLERGALTSGGGAALKPMRFGTGQLNGAFR